MAFPPNYRQQRQDRQRSKNRKSEDKQMRREAKSLERKTNRMAEPHSGSGDSTGKTEKEED